MNKSEKIICLVLGAVLAWYVFSEFGKAKKSAERSDVVETNAEVAPIEAKAMPIVAEEPEQKPVNDKVEKPTIAEKIFTLENDLVCLELSSWGATVRKATLKQYAKDVGEVSAKNPAVELDFALAPIGAADAIEVYELVENDGTNAIFVSGTKTRKISLRNDYCIDIEDSGVKGPISIGAMRMGDSKNDLLSVDSWALDTGKGKEGVVHHCEGDSPLKPYLVGGLSGGCSGCSGTQNAADWPKTMTAEVNNGQRWIAIKNRFFVTALVSSSEQIRGFSAKVKRDTTSQNYRPESVSAMVNVQGDSLKRRFRFYIGPKKQALLWELGMKDVMEFGMWRWICYPLVWVLNFFNDYIPNYGVAIILLTILVRILFWPLTHKSTVGMKKMQEIQPKMKELQAKFKDNPQRLQQETWALYKAEKVNPMSSCLPMLIQIPVFIALFNVLRSAVELRYAGFLWISDLSEPEGLLSAYLPFGGLNLLPILMALTTGLQSYFTPSAGDKSQQKMMMVFMPAMMLVMFYSFPSALSLYWFLSNILSIVQMWMIRRSTAKASRVLVPEVIDPPQTRQMRRHG